MCNVFKKYRKIIFIFMIIFISSFLGVNKVEAATALKSGNCVINSAGEYYLGKSYTCKYFYINASNVTLELNGYTLSVNEQFVVSKNLRNVTIQDSKGTGVIQSVSSTQKKLSTIRIATNSRVNIIGGSYYNKTNLGAIFSLDGVTFEERDNGYHARLDLKGVHAEMNFSDIEYSQEVQKNSRDSIIKYNGYASGGSTCNIYATVILRADWENRSAYINNVGGNSRIASGENSNCKVKSSPLYLTIHSGNNVKSASGKILKFFTDENDWSEGSITYAVIGEDGKSTRVYLEPFTHGIGNDLSYVPPVPAGYVFTGWYNAPDLKTIDEKYKIEKITETDIGNFSVYTKFELQPYKPYNINYYNGNTKITGLTPSTYKMGDTVTLPTYSVTGYTFGGWYTDKNYTTNVTTITSSSTGDKTFYAKMTPNTYSITYYDGSTKITNLTPTSYKYGTGATLPTYSKTGYVFEGWYSDSALTKKVTSISKTDIGNKTYYAKTTPNTYKISYYDGDTPLTNLSPTTYTYAIGANLPTYSKVGYTFKGWSTSKEGTNIITKISTSDIENKVLYAVFDANEYKVNYVLNGGVNNSKNPQSYVYNSNQFKLLDGSTLSAVATSLKDASKEGYTLQGWYGNENFTGEEITAIATVSAKDQTYYAKWTPNMYTITLDDTIGNTKTIKGIYDSKLQNVEPITRIGYTFDGYATKNGVKYFDANGVNTKAWNIAEDTTLYAQWIPNDQTITWIDGNGNVIYSGNAKYDDMPVYDESKYGLPIKDADFESGVGYVFKGWSPEITTVTGDATYTALFEEVDSFDIKYYYGKVLLTGLTPESYKVSVETELPTEIPGYSFDGWYLEDYLKTKIEKISKTTSGDITIYAKPLSVYRDDYVYDNLILHLDGIDHGSVTGIWEDLSKSNNDVILAPNHIVDKKLVETTKVNGVATSSKTKSIIFEEEPDEFTIEIISEFYSDKDGSVAAIKNGAGGIVFNQVNKIQYGPSYQFESKLNTRVHRSITYNKTNNTLKVYENGVLLETIESPEVTNFINNKLQLGGLDSDATLNLDGAIYSVRIYDAELTEEQIKQNYETDKERFSSDVDYMKDDLVIYLDGKNKGNTEGIWKDLSGNGNHGTINGATYNGKNGFTFDGINDYVDFGKQHFYEDVTLEALITPNEIDKYRSIFTSQDGGGYALTISSNAIGATSHIGGSYTNMSVDYANDKRMIHLTYTVGNGYEKLYLDGVLVKAEKINGTIKGPGSLYTKLTLGANNNAAADGSTSTYTEHFYGTIHTARVYKRALTEGEVLENYKLDKEKYNPDTDYVRDGMIIHLDGTNKGNTEGIWQDLSGNNNHGTIKGATYNGKDGFKFDGQDDVVSFDKQHFYENVTMEAVVSIDDLSKSSMIIGTEEAGGYGIISSDGALHPEVYVDGAYAILQYDKYTPSDLVYVTYTIDSSYQKLYVDGVLVASSEITGTITGPNKNKDIHLSVGANHNGTELYSRLLDGTIYAVRLYNRVLSASEVKQNYNLDKDKYSTGDYAQGGMIIHLDGTNKGDTPGIWQDISGNNNHGKVNGATYNGVNGFKFDGTDDYVAFDDQHYYENTTLEVMVSPKDLSSTSNISLFGVQDEGGHGIDFSTKDGYLRGSSDIAGDYTYVTYPYKNNQMVHITYTIDGQIQKLYVDGKLVQTKEVTGRITGPDDIYNTLTIGADNDTSTDGSVIKYDEFFSGTVYDAKLYSRALTEEEVKADYDEAKEKYGIEDDLIIHLDATNKGNTEGVWEDLSGNGNHGTINGATYNGVNGFEFDGTDDYVAFDDQHFYENVTMEAVVSINDLSKISSIIATEESGGYGILSGSNVLRPEVRVDGTYVSLSYDKYTPGDLVHIAYTIDSSYHKLYVDGVLVASSEITGTITGPDKNEDIHLSVGANHNITSDGTNHNITSDGTNHNITSDGTEWYDEYLDGTIYDIKLYSRALSANEVKENYTEVKSKFINDYKIHYYNGSLKLDGIEPSGYEQNESIELGTTEIDGYTLEGWYTSPTFEEDTKKTQVETSDSGDIKVYGKFVPNKYTISFESNGGGEVESITADYGTEIVLPSTVRENYDFIGWYTSEEFTEEATTDVPLGDATYYAKWEPKTYNINYYSGLIKLDMEPSTYTYGVGATLPTEVPGYTFGGWYTTDTFDEGTEVTEITTTDSGDKILFAKLSVQEFTISFEENEGSEVTDITGPYGTPVTEPVHPTKENFVFGGWYSDVNLTIPYQFSIIPASDITLYAKWNGIPHTVTWLNADGSEIYTEEVEYGKMPIYDEETYKVPVNTEEVEDGYEYKFIGWDKELTEVIEDISYTASFEKTPLVYNINYYVGGILLSGISPNTYTYGESTILPELNLTGYKSSGWYTSPTFESETQLTEIEATSIGDITVYAKINTDEYTISFEENGGTEVADITKVFEEVVEKPEDPTRENYIFEGWYTEPEFITEYEFTTMPGTDITLYAKWSGVPYKITWLNKDDVEIYSSEVEYGSIPDYDEETYGIPTYEKTGYTYTFKGWDPEVVEVTGEATYKAQYEEVANTYNITYYNGENIIDDLEPNTYTYGVETILPEYVLEGYLFEGWYTSNTFDENTKVEKMTETDIEDKVLYAKVSIQKYTINFEENGGSEVENITSEYEATIELPESTKDGYTFDGWYIDELLENKFESTTMPGVNTTLYAKWIANEYEITYYNGLVQLEGLIPTTYIHGNEVMLPLYEKTGYTFEGWYTTNTFDEGTKVESITETEFGNKTVYAKMVAKQYTITFEENGGNLVEDITADYESEITLPEASRDGYTFEGWYMDEALENKFEVTTMPNESITVYAKWVEGIYEISYYKGNIKLEGMMPTSYTYGVGSTLPTEVEGYTLEGWYTTDTFDEGTKVESITTTDFGNKVLYANMTINEYTLTFIENDGTDVEDIVAEYGTTIELPTTTKEGHTLEGWYTSETFDEGTKFEATTMPGDNLTLYAKWNINVYNITWVDGDGEIIYTEEYEYNQTPSYFEQMGEPTKTSENKAVSYEFKGWSPQIVPATSNRIYSAQFDEIIAEYDITYYDDNYNFLGLTPNTYIYGVGTELPTYEKEGYTFDGWYTSSEFKEEDKVENISETDSGDKELFAKLTTKQYTISFEENSGSEVEDITADYNSEIELPTPTLDGYTLEGWYTTQNFDEGTKFESTTMPAENVTLYAKWEVTKYTIYFEENGGTEVEDITGLRGTDVIVPTEPTKEGYTFDGWYSDIDLTTPYEFSVMPSENITLYAKWNVNKYTINFEENGGSEVENITEDYGTEVMAPTEPTKEGNVFDGWYSDIDLTTPYSFTTMPGSDITLYAKWFTNEYTITFNTLGGSEIEPITKAYGTEITAPEIPTREYSSFVGWYLDSEYTTEFEFTTMPAEDTILYAKWDVEKFTITYANPDGSVIYTEEVEYATTPEYDEATYGIPTYNKTGYTTVFREWDREFVMAAEDTTYTALYEETPNNYSIEYYYGNVLLEGMTPIIYTYEVGTELPEYTLEYYTFEGWYTTNTFDEGTKVEKISETDFGDKVLYANMVINQYTISFDSNEGTEVESITADYNSVVEAPVEPIKEGYTFAGWYSDEELNTPYVFTTMPAEDITVYAKWNINQYTITFIENGGTEVTDITADYNSVVEAPTAPTREHYIFDNWYIDEELTTPYEFSVMPLDGITLYAKWIGVPHTITWLNGEETIYTEEVEYGTLPSYDETTYGVPTKEVDGYTYTFTGWDPEVVEVTGDITYKAVFNEEVNTYNITYYNGEVKLEGIEPMTYVYGIGTELPTYEMNGYTFEGWYSDETLETKVEKITETDLEDKVLYAKMVRNEFTIYFETNGGTTIEPVKQTAGEPITAPTEPTKVGYVFDNWYTDETLETPFEFNVMPENDITLYAKWNEIQIEIVNKEIELFVDEEQQININTIPEGATLTFTYTPTDNIVSVSETGLIKGLTAGETTVTVKVTENPNIEETITVKVNSKEIESETYSVEQKEDVKIVIGMDEGVTIETLLNSLTNKSDYLNVYDKEGNKITDHTQVVSTGLKIKLEKEDKVYDEVTTIVRGDINEDGIINITDKLTLVNHIVAKEEITDYRIYSCELEIDGIINVSDKLKLVEYIVQKIPTLN